MKAITNKMTQLPLTVNPVLSARQRAYYEGNYPPDILVRLAAATEGVMSTLRATLCFERDTQQLIVVSGSAAVEVSLICQRCSEHFLHTLSVDYCVSPVVSDDAAKRLPLAYDPVLLDQHDCMDLVTLIEDELLLGLPLVATHPLEECQSEILRLFLDNREELHVADTDKDCPSTTLAYLKKKSLRSDNNGSTKKS